MNFKAEDINELVNGVLGKLASEDMPAEACLWWDSCDATPPPPPPPPPPCTGCTMPDPNGGMYGGCCSTHAPTTRYGLIKRANLV